MGTNPNTWALQGAARRTAHLEGQSLSYLTWARCTSEAHCWISFLLKNLCFCSLLLTWCCSFFPIYLCPFLPVLKNKSVIIENARWRNENKEFIPTIKAHILMVDSAQQSPHHHYSKNTSNLFDKFCLIFLSQIASIHYSVHHKVIPADNSWAEVHL